MAKDLTNIYNIDAEKGVVKYTIKAHGEYFTGVSKTNLTEGDIFDEEKGKRIAKLRAILKMKKTMLKWYLSDLEWIREVASMEEDCQSIVQALTQSTENVQQKLNDILEVPVVEEPVLDTSKPVDVPKKRKSKKSK